MIEFRHLPVEPLAITSKFGKRNTGIVGASTFHKGIDLGRNRDKENTPIYAVAAGSIKENRWSNTRGWVVVLDHGDFETLYQHLKFQCPLPLKLRVPAGQKIGIMGSTSKTIKNMGEHLHFELIVNGESIDPLPYLMNRKEEFDLTREETLNLIKEVLKGDSDTASVWAQDIWEEAKKEGIVDGSNPKGYCTREQVVTMIKRAEGKAE